MRIFIALKLPEKAKNNLEKQCAALAPFLTRGKVVPKENLHVTLQFLGETDPSRLMYVQKALDEVKNLPAPALSVTQIVAWRSANVVCGKFKTWNLDEIHRVLTENLEKYDFPTENRAFRPHVTLIRNYAFGVPFSEAVKSVPLLNKPFTAEEICLFETVFAENGTHYRPLYSVRTKTDE